MPAVRLLPADEELIRMRDSGMTHKQMTEVINERNRSLMGSDFRPVGRGAVSTALSRLKVTDRIRYDDQIPWRVQARHQAEYPLWMLRLKARRERALPVTVENRQRLDNWLAWLEENNCVVDYWPDDRVVGGELLSGFQYVPRDPKRDDPSDVIRRPER